MTTHFKPVTTTNAGPSSRIAVRALGRDVITALKNDSGDLQLISWRVTDDLTTPPKIVRNPGSGHAGSVGEVALLLLDRRAVTAVRSGAGNLLLISWSLPPNTPQITRLRDSGDDAEAASAIAMAAVADSIIVTAVRAGDGHLLLITWKLNPDGTFMRLADSVDQAGQVSLVSIIATANNDVITAVRTGGGRLMLIAWNVSGDGRNIRRKADSADLAGAVSEVAIISARNVGQALHPTLLTAVRNASGHLQVIAWRYSGTFERLGSAEAGTASHVAISPASMSSSSTTYVASMRNGSDGLELIAFELDRNGGLTRTGEYSDQAINVTETAIIEIGNGTLTAARRQGSLNLTLWEVLATA